MRTSREGRGRVREREGSDCDPVGGEVEREGREVEVRNLKGSEKEARRESAYSYRRRKKILEWECCIVC